LLLQPKQHNEPFPFFFVKAAFSEEHCHMLEQLFLQNNTWQHQDGEFYRCSLCDVTETIPATFLSNITIRMREVTGLPLTNRVLVTAQRMLPGQVIGIHSDRPLLGYEMVRLVVQLNREWQAEHGGVLELYSSSEGNPIFSIKPKYNKAVGFLLDAHSYHGVTEVTQPRQSVVFNFWHMANTPELADHIEALFANLNFSEFPESLNSIASIAESSLPEDVTFRAGTAAIALYRWGYDARTIVTGYKHSAGIDSCENGNIETFAAVLLADWIAYLYRETFDLTRWSQLQSALAGVEIFPRLRLIWKLCLPESGGVHLAGI